MLSIVIPTLNAKEPLARLLQQLALYEVQIIVSDGMSIDETLNVAARYQTNLAIGAASRGAQMQRGTFLARGDWLLFLHADSVLSDDWYALALAHMEHYPGKAAFFGLKYDSPKLSARWVELMTAWRCRTTRIPFGWALPYGDQGLLISRELYDDIGGYPDWPLFEDVKIVEKIGRLRIRHLGGKITTCDKKHDQDGFIRRGWRNFRLMRRYKKGESIDVLVKEYN